MNVKIAQLKKTVNLALKNYGYDKKETAIISEILLYAQLRGNNQGIVKLIGKGIPKNKLAGKIKILKDTKLSTVIDGNNNFGMIAMKKAMDMAIKKAKKYGFGISATHNTASSTGAIGFYANEIAKTGFIGFVFAGSPETVATFGSYEPIFGTNPLAIGIPTKNTPVVLDMATAAMAWFGLVEAKTAGRKIPSDVAYDKNGKLTSDPAQAMDGAIRTFDRSYKSAGLAMIVEILTGPLVKASFTGIGSTSTNWGNLIFVIDPELLTDRREFAKQVSQMVDKVKHTKKLPGVKEIYVPGERGNNLTKERLSKGSIEIEDNLWKELQKAAGH